MIHPDTVLQFISPEIGYGVFATREIPMGTVTWVHDSLDQILTPAQVQRMPEIYADPLTRYTYRTPEGNYVLLWDLARFMNHSCSPNCMGTHYGFEIAVKDIPSGGELTVDYVTLYMTPEESFDCYCRSPGCRWHITGDDMEALGDQWAGVTEAGLLRIWEVEQPLLHLLNDASLQRACEEHGVPYQLRFRKLF
ncbi:MAG: SET domain-containing protein-lysine N-methyltransferase [Nitrospinota bacterium]